MPGSYAGYSPKTARCVRTIFSTSATNAVELRRRPGVMRGEAERVAVDRELANRHRAELGRAVHQVLKIGRGELERRGPRVQLRRDAPARLAVAAAGRFERDGRGTIVEPARPHDRRRHVDVRVRRVDREVGAVDAVAEHFVAHGHRRPPCCGTVHPYGSGRVTASSRPSAPTALDVVHVLREIVQRIAAWRRPAHAQLERRALELGERRISTCIQ